MSDVEIPFIILDEVEVADDIFPVQVTMQMPPPNAEDVAVDQVIYFDLINIAGGTFNGEVSTIDVWVSVKALPGDPDVWEHAVDAGAFPAGYAGTLTLKKSPGSAIDDILRFVVNRAADFPQGYTVKVIVGQVETSNDYIFAFAWSMTVVDLQEPDVLLSTLTIIDSWRMRFTFDEEVVRADPAGATDALNPANYLIRRQYEVPPGSPNPDIPAAALSVASVSFFQLDGSGNPTMELLLDREMSPDGAYNLTITGVADLAGNVMSSPSLNFTGFRPTQPPRRQFDLWRMIPQINREEDSSGDLRKFIRILQEMVDLSLASVDRFTDLIDPDTAPDDAVPWILYMLGNPFDLDLTLDQKRTLAGELLQIYGLKGTSPGIEAALASMLGLVATVEEYFDNGATWSLGESELGVDTYLTSTVQAVLYSFDVRVDRALTATELEILQRIVAYMKPAHTHHKRTLEP